MSDLLQRLIDLNQKSVVNAREYRDIIDEVIAELQGADKDTAVTDEDENRNSDW